MTRFRIVIQKNEADPSLDLEIAASLRRDLWVHSPVEFDPLDGEVKTKRALDRAAYLEFETEFPEEVERVIREFGYDKLVRIERSTVTSRSSSSN